MIEKQTYLELKGISRRAYFYQLKSGRITQSKRAGKIFVVDPEFKLPLNITISDETKLTLEEEAKKELDALILKAHSLRAEQIKTTQKTLKKSPHNNQITMIINEIGKSVKAWQSRGVHLKGYSPKACYKKISKVEKLVRQRRSDLFELKNKVLVNPEAYKKLEAAVNELYHDDKSKRPSKRMLTKRISQYAQEKEEFYELAAIPFSTLYDHVKKIIDRLGLHHKHLLENNFSEFNRKRPYVLGAFTNDIEFMDWYAMDDHVMEVDGALVYNPVKQAWEKKKVYLWTVIECKTLFPVAYHIQADDFNFFRLSSTWDDR